MRFILKGRGLFHIHPESGPVFAIQVEAGDLINVPKGTKHWFDLCEDKTIRAIRLFQDMTGWTPQYIDGAARTRYTPVCWRPVLRRRRGSAVGGADMSASGSAACCLTSRGRRLRLPSSTRCCSPTRAGSWPASSTGAGASPPCLTLAS